MTKIKRTKFPALRAIADLLDPARENVSFAIAGSHDTNIIPIACAVPGLLDGHAGTNWLESFGYNVPLLFQFVDSDIEHRDSAAGNGLQKGHGRSLRISTVVNGRLVESETQLPSSQPATGPGPST